jgi:phosphohistidine phosphatase
LKRLTLFRHAKSCWDDESIADHDRPLAARGRDDAPRMGERLRVRKARPSLIITSSAKRARQTARIVAKVIGYPREFLQADRALYLAEPSTILAIIGAHEDTFADLMLFGHNPGLTDLANLLISDLRLDNLPTAGFIAIDFDTDRWANVGPERGRLAYYDYPKNPNVTIVED